IIEQTQAVYPMWAVLLKQHPHLLETIEKSFEEPQKFLIYNSGKEIFIPNVKRTVDPALLKLSLNGLTIDKVTGNGPNDWYWELNDKTKLRFQMSAETADPKQVMSYTIVLPGGGEKREICFHYAYRNA